MTKLNNEIRDLNSDELDQVSGGDNRVPWGAQKIVQENYERIRERAEVQNYLTSLYNEVHHPFGWERERTEAASVGGVIRRLHLSRPGWHADALPQCALRWIQDHRTGRELQRGALRGAGRIANRPLVPRSFEAKDYSEKWAWQALHPDWILQHRPLGLGGLRVIVKTYSVTNLAVKDAARRYSPAEVVAVSREVVSGIPAHISTSYVERQNLRLRMTQKRFARLTNGFSKKLTNHAAAVSLYVTHYNLCRVHEALRTTPGSHWESPTDSGPSATC
jgi:hypothetical protein